LWQTAAFGGETQKGSAVTPRVPALGKKNESSPLEAKGMMNIE
jgi:hypothetical protein